MDRRLFLAHSGTVVAAAALPNLSMAAKAPSSLSILQGLTTETTTQLTVDLPKNQAVVYTLKEVASGKVHNPEWIKPVTFGTESMRVDKVKFFGLSLGEKYQFIVTDKKTNQILDDRFLTTVDLNKKNARIAVMSCMNDSSSAVSKIWASAEKADYDYVFFIGDNVYGDLWIIYGPNYLWGRYIQSRKNIPFYHWKNLKPVIAIWDDHDFGKNNAGGDYKYKDYSYQIFKAFFAQEPQGETLINGWANSVYFQAFGQNFVFFDNRYYRGLQNTDGTTGFLGTKQIDWMSATVNARKKSTWVIQGSPFFGRTEKDSYQTSAPEELDYLAKKIKSWGVPTLFFGGDLHFTEISKVDRSFIGQDSFEVISSCMHSNTKSQFYDNPHQRVNGFLKENFVILEQSENGVWKTTCIAQNTAKPFETVLKVG